MTTGYAGVIGHPPRILIQPAPPKKAKTEKEKYEKVWALDEYRKMSPGETAADLFLKVACPPKGEHVLDFGTGTGRGALMLAILGQVRVTMIDFASNCLDEDIRNALKTQAHMLDFVEEDLTKTLTPCAKYGFCVDVMEHIPTAHVDTVLQNILTSAQHVFFQICTKDDVMGTHPEVQEELHLTVRPFEWWAEKFKEFDATVQWSSVSENGCAFYVSAWQPATILYKYGELNSARTTIEANIVSAIGRNLSECKPHEKTDTPIMLLAGGPSMLQFEEEIKTRRAAGEKLITCNGAYNWAMERGIVPSAQAMLDSREFNTRFLSPVHPKVQYLLSSQCSPAAFDAVPAEQTLLWHSAVDDTMLDFIEQKYLGTSKPWYPILGGSTIMLRLIPLMLVLGYHRFEVFGWDSCLADDGSHHGYTQDENDHTIVLNVLVNKRVFKCHSWMISQCQEFLDLFQKLANDVELIVHGDGLIAWCIQTAAEQGDPQIEVIENA